MRVNWVERPEDAQGNHLGFAVHNRESKAALERAGGIIDPRAEMTLTVQSPLSFFPQDTGTVHGIYTAWDSPSAMPAMRCLKQADFIISTASYLVPTYREIVGESTPIYVCPLGVHADTFARKKKRKLAKNERFRVLWLGAPNQRKGYPAFLAAAHSLQEWPFDFYLKTTLPGGDERGVETKKLGSNARLIVDSRKLPLDELVQVYHDAHAFVFPSGGEGFGLTLAEAMAAGLPCLFTPWSAMTDYCDGRVAFPLKYEAIRTDISPNLPEDWPNYEDLCGEALVASPDVGSICDRLVWVFQHYKQAVARGQLAAARIRSGFTWEHTGRRLREILEEVDRTWLHPSS